MRNLHLHIYQELKKEYVVLLWEWDDLAKKIADISNHRRFSLRCLNAEITPVSLRLKSNLRSPEVLKS